MLVSHAAHTSLLEASHGFFPNCTLGVFSTPSLASLLRFDLCFQGHFLPGSHLAMLSLKRRVPSLLSLFPYTHFLTGTSVASVVVWVFGASGILCLHLFNVSVKAH